MMNNVLRGSLVLPEDLLIIPVAELPAAVREKLGDDGEEFAITRPLAREPSKLIDAAAADLIEQFRQPRTIVQAVISYSRKNQADPERTLDDSLPLLRQLLSSGLLLPEGSKHATRIQEKYQADARVGRFTVVRCIQVLDDSELYQAFDEIGRYAALKIAREDHVRTMQPRLNREADALRRLGGQGAARLLECGEIEGRPFIATEWLLGTDAATEADMLREDADRQGLLELLVSIARAYAWVHSRGVIHGDVHPGNIFVDRDRKVTLLDFGLAQFTDSPADPKLRGGVSFFFEPEYARAALDREPPPSATQQSEQFAVGALLYMLATGHHYMDFSLQQEEMFRQIRDTKPLPFAHRAVEAWPDLERALARALMPTPDSRHATMAKFTEALESVELPVRSLLIKTASPLEAVVEGIISHVDLDSSLYRNGLPQGPLCSVNFGASGIAYALYRLSCRRDNPALLAAADAWILKSQGDAESETAFYNPDLDMTEETIGRVSPYHSRSGAHLVQAIISEARGESAMRDAAAQEFLTSASALCTQRDLCLGRCGTVLGSAMLLELRPPGDDQLSCAIHNFAEQRLNDLWVETTSFDVLSTSRDWPNLGVAHGWAGLLYVTLRWHILTGDTQPASFHDRLDQLLRAARPNGRGVSWPWRQNAGDPDLATMPGWCNGSAGMVHLASLAHRVLKDDFCVQLSEAAAWHVWEAGAGPVDLCCGYAGRAYALLEVYRMTGNRRWLEKAQALAMRAARAAPEMRIPDHPRHSLYKGELGLALLIADLECPMEAAMPLFASEG